MLEHEVLRTEDASRTLRYEVTTGRLEMVDTFDEGRNRLSNGLVYDSRVTNTFSIVDKQPTSASVECKREIEISRDDWNTRVETSSLMTSDKEFFHLTNVLNAYEGAVRVCTKSWARKIRRDMV